MNFELRTKTRGGNSHYRVRVISALVDHLSRLQLSNLHGINVVPDLLPVKGPRCKRVHCQPHLVIIIANIKERVCLEIIETPTLHPWAYLL